LPALKSECRNRRLSREQRNPDRRLGPFDIALHDIGPSRAKPNARKGADQGIQDDATMVEDFLRSPVLEVEVAALLLGPQEPKIPSFSSIDR
jgi:hypothetical protein